MPSASKTSVVTRAILQAYGYTAETLAIDCEIGRKVATRILYGSTDLYLRDVLLLNECILGADIDFLFGRPGPGNMKAERERRETERAEKEQKDAEWQTEWAEQRKQEREAWRQMTPQEKCADLAKALLPLGDGWRNQGFTVRDVAEEMIRQAEKEGAA